MHFSMMMVFEVLLNKLNMRKFLIRIRLLHTTHIYNQTSKSYGNVKGYFNLFPLVMNTSTYYADLIQSYAQNHVVYQLRKFDFHNRIQLILMPATC